MSRTPCGPGPGPCVHERGHWLPMGVSVAIVRGSYPGLLPALSSGWGLTTLLSRLQCPGHMQTQRAFRACLWQCPVWPAEGAPARHMVQQPRFQGQPGLIRVPSGGTGPSGSQNCALATIARASHPFRTGLGCPLGGGLRMSSQRWPARLYLEGPFPTFACQRPAFLPGPVPGSVPDHLSAPGTSCALCPLLCPCLALL